MSDKSCLMLIEGLETVCAQCGGHLCLRQQVLNLALGADDNLLCLRCLAADNDKEPQQLLGDLGPYVLSRECFYKEWRKYKDQSDCPDRVGCLPERCFSFT